MARKRRSTPLDDLTELASKLPYWLSLGLALIIFLVLDHYTSQPVTMQTQVGSALPTNMTSLMFRPLLLAAQYLVPLALVLGAAISAFKAFTGRKLAKQYISTPDEGISSNERAGRSRPSDSMSWQQFELLVGEAFRQSGYRVIDGGDIGPDGGVDVHLKKDGQTYLVQCKHWKTQRVGVAVIRELFGIMVDRGAKGGFIVTSGDFTEEARSFASGKAIGLIDGQKLDKMLRKAGQPAPEDNLKATENASETIYCPKCSSTMVKRIARRGANTGQEFWGCSRYPKCRGVRPLTE
ncbi:restriction endonuclease [Marinobacterium sp. YM272]|uniref:restriction endonuclease n=1 Tax=Marinobacterium sp. YM272 TaxID=3421654 RepID=UPI003D7FDE29